MFVEDGEENGEENGSSETRYNWVEKVSLSCDGNPENVGVQLEQGRVNREFVAAFYRAETLEANSGEWNVNRQA